MLSVSRPPTTSRTCRCWWNRPCHAGCPDRALASVTAVKAGNAPDLSAYGTPVETIGPVHPVAPLNEPTTKHWPAYVCAEIRRTKNVVISGQRPADRGMTRLGLLMLEGLHCGIDVSKKMAADQALLEDAQRKADRDYEESMAAAQRAASRLEEPIIVQVPQAVPEPAAPAPPPTLNCFTTRLGGGMSTTTCQ
ncbi:hypothetical protein SAMN05444158_4454 [Bradyrhizobium canariense]|uniref:Uncharacterized protein n=1 Tax=Bradyrhizobium canariense TaxID=255045 RepID=A0A1H1XSE6_9BRAD|nr:hypothetical protein SAMN05444158_4454 [Bradyrhizobium canariense]